MVDAHCASCLQCEFFGEHHELITLRVEKKSGIQVFASGLGAIAWNTKAPW
jgi:hypothetical protein